MFPQYQEGCMELRWETDHHQTVYKLAFLFRCCRSEKQLQLYFLLVGETFSLQQRNTQFNFNSKNGRFSWGHDKCSPSRHNLAHFVLLVYTSFLIPASMKIDFCIFSAVFWWASIVCGHSPAFVILLPCSTDLDSTRTFSVPHFVYSKSCWTFRRTIELRIITFTM